MEGPIRDGVYLRRSTADLVPGRNLACNAASLGLSWRGCARKGSRVPPFLVITLKPPRSQEEHTAVAMPISAAAAVASDSRYRQLFDANPRPLLVCAPLTHAVIEANRAASAMYGYSHQELLQHTLDQLEAGEPRERGRRRGLLDGRPELRWHHKRDGTRVAVELSFHNIDLGGRQATLVEVDDVSERLHLEEKVIEAARLEAIGRLAGGLAHDLNNLLTVIRGSATLAKLDLEPASSATARLAAIERSALKAEELIRQLLAFGRRQLLRPRRIDLHELLVRVEPLLRQVLVEEVELSFEIEDQPAWVELDPSQLEQVLVSLALFARESMPEGGRLELIVVPEQTPPSEHEVTSSQDNFHLLLIRDTGRGLDPEALDHLFEPFYLRSGGTGLGLAMVYGVVRQSGGFVEVDSLPGQGTSFRLYFPKAKFRAPTVEEGVAVELGAVLTPRARRPVVLVVEDQLEVRCLLRDLLTNHGIEVHEACSGLDALALAQQLEGRIDLLLTDVVMPGMNGREVALRIELLWPGTPVLYLSGYAEDVLGEKGVLEAGVELIAKPFEPEDLLARVSRLLARAPAQLPPSLSAGSAESPA